MNSNNITTDSLGLFHPLIGRWFRERIGTPTDIQNLAWPEITQGNHVLVTAPTGSGKTLTAFLWAINSFIGKSYPHTAGRVLYISPLKALNNDIRRNLEEPITELRLYFETGGEKFPDIQIAVRSGDTDYTERRRMSSRPPDIFITTPESLNILLSSKNYQNLLHGISTVILDEIHAVAPTKRGTYLMTAVERLVPLCGEFQRIALSATVKPLEVIADFIAGYSIRKNKSEYLYEKRNVKILQSRLKKEYFILINYPEPSVEPTQEEEWWQAIAQSLRKVIAQNHSTLIFANSRRMVEKITRLINDFVDLFIKYL